MSSLQYRKDRMTTMANQWGASKVNDLFIRKRIPDHLYSELRRSIGIYISKALHFEYTQDDISFIERLNAHRNDRNNTVI